MIFDYLSHDTDRTLQEHMRDDEAQPNSGMDLHQVGIVRTDPTLIHTLRALTGMTIELPRAIEFRHAPESNATATSSDESTSSHRPTHEWVRARRRNGGVVSDRNGEPKSTASSSTAETGVRGLGVNLPHPSHCGFLVELVEPK